jgi:hypothetical protein
MLTPDYENRNVRTGIISEVSRENMVSCSTHYNYKYFISGREPANCDERLITAAT